MSESSNRPKMGKEITQLSWHLPEIHKFTCEENLLSNRYLVAFIRHRQCTKAINESISHSW